jgi:DNA polymerase III alpha subunit (gram-positive type)
VRAVILDTETTGLISNHILPLDKQPRIIEFYAHMVDLTKGETIIEINTLINPGHALEDVTTKITGLKDEDLKEAPSFKDCALGIQSFLEQAPWIIGHNMSFDKEIIDFEFERLKRRIKWPRLTCTVEATPHQKGFRLNLQTLHEWLFGEGFPEAHRAKTDVMALTKCCVELFKRGYI